MKWLLIVLLVAAIGISAGIFTWVQSLEKSPDKTTGEMLDQSFPLEVVFQRAFWRPPGVGDRIRQGIRREWSDAPGVKRWQSFLAVEPGPAFRDWLATNPFSLATVSSLNRKIPDPPGWFPNNLDGFTIQQAPFGNLVLLTAPGGAVVYFADYGMGFARPAETPVPPKPAEGPANRLPNAPPPVPGK